MRCVTLLVSVLVAVTGIAATCASGVRQLGDEGPWVGTVTNVGDQPVHGVTAQADIIDANGVNLWGRLDVEACPSLLLPGERGAVELDMHDPGFNPLAGAPPEYELPLRADFQPLAEEHSGYGAYRSDGLFVHETGRDAARGRVTVAIWNNARAGAYRDLTVCVVRLDAPRNPVDVAWLRLPETTDLRPGQMTTRTISLAPYPEEAPLRYYAWGSTDAPTPSCCPASGPSSWQSVDTGPFSMMLPPGWAYEPLQGIDSFVGRVYGDGVELFFDYGWYSNPLAPYGDPDHHVWDESVSGRIAKMVVAHDPAGVVGVFFEDVGAPPASTPHIRTRLQLSGEGLDNAEREIALQMFRLLRFDER